MKLTLKRVASVITAAAVTCSCTVIMPVSASAASSGFTGKQKTQTDGSKIITLIPSDGDNYITYTLDGSQPDQDSIYYDQPFRVTSSSKVRAAEFSSDDDSYIKGISFSVNVSVATPYSSVEYLNGSSVVTLTTETAGATIYYTTDGTKATENSTEYTGPITITKKTTFNFAAFCEGYSKSASVAKTVSIKTVKTGVTTTTNTSSASDSQTTTNNSTGWQTGAITSPATTSTTTTATNSSSWRNGIGTGTDSTTTTPTTASNNTWKSGVGTVSDSTTTPKTTTTTTTTTTKTTTKTTDTNTETTKEDTSSYATTSKESFEVSTQIKYNCEYFPLKTTTNIVLSAQKSGNKIYYTIDGSDPTKNGKKYTGKIAVNKKTGLRAVEYDSAGNKVASLKVNILIQCKPVKPEITNYVSGMAMVRLTCATPGTEIYYTTDATTPTVNSTKYTKEFPLTFGGCVKAIAVRSGYRNSTAEKTACYDIPLAIDEFDFSDPLLAQIADLANQYRASQNLDPLTLDLGLSRAAFKRAKEMTMSTRSDKDSKRPNGLNWITAISEEDVAYLVAVYSAGTNLSVESMANKIAYRSDEVQNAKYNKVGIGRYEYGGKVYWYAIITRS